MLMAHRQNVPHHLTLESWRDSPQGKPELRNAHLCVLISVECDGGKSSTWVPQRFMKMLPGQTAPFQAQVYLLDAPNRKKLITEVLEKYRHSTTRNDMSEGAEDQEVSAEKSVDAKMSLEALEAIFDNLAK